MLGEFLKSHREKNNLSIDDIASLTKVNKKHLIAIEENDFSRIPGEVFVRGFIKEYAQCVSVDPVEALKIYDETINKPVHEVEEPVVIENGKDKSVAYILGAIILLSVVFLVIKYLPVLRSNIEMMEKSQIAVQSVADNNKSEDTEAIKKQEEANKAEADLKAAAEAKAKEEAEAKAKEAADAKAKAEAELKAKEEAKATAKAKAKEEAKAKAKEELAASNEDKHTLVVTAIDDTWVSVKSDDGKSKSMTIKAGQKKRYSANEKFVVKVGNASGIRISFDGVDAGVIGENGETKILNFPAQSEPPQQ